MSFQGFVPIFFALCVHLCFARGAEIRSPCPPKPQTVSELNVTRYSGRWYQMQGMKDIFVPAGSQCIASNYGLNDNGTVSVRNSLISAEGEYDEICGYAEQPDPVNAPGELVVYLQGAGKGDYWILDTDYNSFSAVYACEEILGVLKIEFAWVLTRDKIPNQEAIAKARQAFIDHGIDVSNFSDVIQSDQYPCFFDPPNGEPNCLETV